MRNDCLPDKLKSNGTRQGCKTCLHIQNRSDHLGFRADHTLSGRGIQLLVKFHLQLNATRLARGALLLPQGPRLLYIMDVFSVILNIHIFILEVLDV